MFIVPCFLPPQLKLFGKWQTSCPPEQVELTWSMSCGRFLQTLPAGFLQRLQILLYPHATGCGAKCDFAQDGALIFNMKEQAVAPEGGGDISGECSVLIHHLFAAANNGAQPHLEKFHDRPAIGLAITVRFKALHVRKRSSSSLVATRFEDAQTADRLLRQKSLERTALSDIEGSVAAMSSTTSKSEEDQNIATANQALQIFVQIIPENRGPPPSPPPPTKMNHEPKMLSLVRLFIASAECVLPFSPPLEILCLLSPLSPVSALVNG
jgi:hypothetical protein